MFDRQAYMKQYYQDHREEKQQYYQDHRDEKLAYAEKYNKDHREEKLPYTKQYYQDHREERLQYAKNNPEVGLRAKKKELTKLGKTFDFNSNQMIWALMNWTTVTRKGKNCSYCGSDKYLQSHHIIPKSKQPGLALNENNGVVLCDSCHKEHHSLNGVN